MIWLKIQHSGKEETFPFQQTRITVGRGKENLLRIEDMASSRRHCAILWKEGRFFLQDLGSRNGTFLNGKRIEEALLKRGDLITIGKTKVEVVRWKSPDELGEKPSLMQSILEINRLLAAECGLRKTLDLIVDNAIALTRAERGFVIFYDGRRLSIPAARNFERERIKKPRLEICTPLAEEVIRKNEETLIRDVSKEERFDCGANWGDRSILCVPLRGKSRVAGSIYVDKKMRGGGFSEDDLWALRALADPAALALLAAKLRSENLRKDKDLEVSRQKIQRLREETDRILEKRKRGRKKGEAQRDALQEKPPEPFRYPYRGIVGKSKALLEVFRTLDKVIDSDVPLLIEGESGTGKELIARAIHFNSARKDHPFICQNCAAIPESLLESELFGYTKGAFTGAIQNTPGIFETANRGTLFLDEVGDMSLEMQKRLLRVLEEGEVRRVGGTTTFKVDVRIISASNKDLERLKETSHFREDFYYRINVVKIKLPPLRERKEDIPLLLNHFIEEKTRELGKARKEISPGAMRALLNYSWPGNVRELENEVRKVLALSGEIIKEEDLSPHIVGDFFRALFPLCEGKTLKCLVEEMEKEIIQRTLERYRGNKTRSSKVLGLSRLGLRKKLERYRIKENW